MQIFKGRGSILGLAGRADLGPYFRDLHALPHSFGDVFGGDGMAPEGPGSVREYSRG